MSRVAVFGGTVEGRMLAEQLADFGFAVCAFVATAYGEDLIQPRGGLTVRQGRLNRAEMTDMLTAEGFDAVVDATHPYAVEVTENLAFAARDAGVFYLFVARDKADCGGVIGVGSCEAAAELLNRMNGNILLTTGSKQLEAFTRVTDFKSRVFARVLPSAEIVQKCEDIGFRGSNLICMQGPFTHDMNAAMIRMLNIAAVVTKDSGNTGGFYEKLSAARECGARLIVIRRPVEINSYKGVSAKSVLDILKNHLIKGENNK